MWLVWTGRQRWVRCIVLCLEVEIDSPDMWASNATSLKSPFYLPFILKKEPPPPPFVPEMDGLLPATFLNSELS
jgi:hypothetical protein